MAAKDDMKFHDKLKHNFVTVLCRYHTFSTEFGDLLKQCGIILQNPVIIIKEHYEHFIKNSYVPKC